MSTFLERILARKQIELARRRSEISEGAMERLVESAQPTRAFLSRLDPHHLGVIAEVKRASPSRGTLASDLDAATQAHRYADGGAIAISVLTDWEFYHGTLDDLRLVRSAVDLPVMRKDFILDRYGLLEARVHGADMVLLIVAALQINILARLVAEARDLGLTPVVEVYTEDEARIALDCGADLVGINNRDLRTFDLSLATTERLASLLTSRALVISFSGMREPADGRRMAATGARAVLIGEALVTSSDPAELIRRFTEITLPVAEVA